MDPQRAQAEPEDGADGVGEHSGPTEATESLTDIPGEFGDLEDVDKGADADIGRAGP